jgi:hypothetical protein
MVAEQAKGLIDGPDQAIWLARLDAEQANMRAVLERAIEQGDAAVAPPRGGNLANLEAGRASKRRTHSS